MSKKVRLPFKRRRWLNPKDQTSGKAIMACVDEVYPDGGLCDYGILEILTKHSCVDFHYTARRKREFETALAEIDVLLETLTDFRAALVKARKNIVEEKKAKKTKKAKK